jgi:GNAT superfamily N-acetyltransferase
MVPAGRGRMHIQPITIAAFFAHPDTSGLLEDYARECSTEGLPRFSPHQDLYEHIERAGALHMLGAFHEERLIGFLVMLVSMNPHYSVPLAVTESWFVAPEHRATGAGLILYRTAKQLARDFGAKALFVSAPSGGKLAGVMEAMGARETNRVFCEVLA